MPFGNIPFPNQILRSLFVTNLKGQFIFEGDRFPQSKHQNYLKYPISPLEVKIWPAPF